MKMPPADTPDTMTPLTRLRRQQRTRWLFGALLTVGLALLAAIVLSVNQGRNFERLVAGLGLAAHLPSSKQLAPASPLTYRRPVSLSVMPAKLIEPYARETVHLRTSSSLTAHERCLAMAQTAAEPPSFTHGPSGWECVISLEAGKTGEDSVLFIQARGISEQSFRTFRAKLSYLAVDQDEALILLTLGSIERFGMNLSPESRRYVEDLLIGKRDASSLLENYRISFERERDDERRFNLIITPRPSTAQCPDPSNGIPGARLQSSTIAIPLGCLGVPASSRLSLFGPVQPD